ncbi:MAG: F0F1 ATP synthase subunit A [Acidimicrobiia bacterium]|nr:F0F1 ATP synthase subunit A [Acidimicrobiia bacterium]
MILGLDFPPISHAIEWRDLFGTHGAFAINKVVLLMWLSVLVVAVFFFIASRRQQLVPTGVQNVAESAVDFVREGIIMQTIGKEGLFYTPFLLTVFSFVFVCNIWEIIPGAQMPVNARMALPMLMALLVWVIFNFVGVKNQGIRYLKNVCFPPGVPWPLYILVAPIEFVSTFLVRPLSLSVRLFANMLAGHLLLISFAVLSTALWNSTKVGAVLPGALLIGLTGFEILVSALQAYIFTILTAVYIGGAMHPEH